MNLDQRSPDSQKRLLLALGLSFLLTLVYMTFFAPKKPAELAGAGPDAGTPVATAPLGTPDGGQAAAPKATPDGGQAVAAAPATPPVELPPVQQVKVDRPPLVLELSNEGGGLTRAELLGEKMREHENIGLAEGYSRLLGKKLAPPPQIDMATPVPGQPLPLAVGISGSQPFPEATRYSVERSEDRVVLTGRTGSWEVVKTLAWAPGTTPYELSYVVEVKNLGQAPAKGELALHYGRAVDPSREHKGSFFGGIGNESRVVCRTGDDVHAHLPDDEAPTKEHQGPLGYFGVDQQYFLGVLFPLEAAKDGRCVLTATKTGRTVTGFFPLEVAPGQTARFAFGLYVGPKDLDLLSAIPAASLGPTAGVGGTLAKVGLEKTVDFGIWALICRVLLAVMKFFYGVFHSWGVAVILLTVVVKLALLPLTHKAMVAAEQMKKLQPRMEELRKKYPEDREKQNMEMMKLYQEAKVNPLGGCLPLLIQMPVWFALNTTLRTSFDIYGEPFLLWSDLTTKDPTYLLPLALGVTMIITQRLQPQMMDPLQAKIMTYGMPVFFTLTLMNFPAGLSLYIFTNNLLSILQQWLLKKWLQKRGIAAPTPPSGGPPAKGKGGGKAKLDASRKATTQ